MGKKQLNTDSILEGLDDDLAVAPDQAFPTADFGMPSGSLELPAEKIMSGRRRGEPSRRRVMVLELDPKICRRWHYHNRFDEWFNYEQCKDLIDDLLVNDQEIPGVVRKLTDDPDGYQYEVVFGGRRHFSVQYINEHHRGNRPFKAIVRDVSDQEAARLMDLENRKRADISDFERCVSFRCQLGKTPGFAPIFQSLTDLQMTLEAGEKQGKVLTKSALSQMVTAGELNEIDELKSLFDGRRNLIPWSHAYRLMRQWNSDQPDYRSRIQAKANELSPIASSLSPENLLKQLLDAAVIPEAEENTCAFRREIQAWWASRRESNFHDTKCVAQNSDQSPEEVQSRRYS